jgi:hypothetical protein
VEDAEARLAHTDHRQWEAVRPVLGQGHPVEDLEEAGEVEVDEVAMDTDQDRTRGPGAGHHAGALRGHRTAGQFQEHRRPGEAMGGAILRRAEVGTVVVVEAVVGAVVGGARVTIPMVAEVRETGLAAGVVSEDEKVGISNNTM